MALRILRYRLYLIDPAGPPTTVHEDDVVPRDVVVMPGDRMRAERESSKLLAPAQRDRKRNAESWMLLWLWCAACRLGVFDGTLEDFAYSLVDYDEVDDAGHVVEPDPTGETEAGTPVDPTAADPRTT